MRAAFLKCRFIAVGTHMGGWNIAATPTMRPNSSINSEMMWPTSRALRDTSAPNSVSATMFSVTPIISSCMSRTSPPRQPSAARAAAATISVPVGLEVLLVKRRLEQPPLAPPGVPFVDQQALSDDAVEQTGRAILAKELGLLDQDLVDADGIGDEVELQRQPRPHERPEALMQVRQPRQHARLEVPVDREEVPHFGRAGRAPAGAPWRLMPVAGAGAASSIAMGDSLRGARQ